MCFLVDAYDVDEAPNTKGGVDKRTVLHLDPRLAPVKAAVLPLVEKADGIVFGAPVHYATAAASMLGFMHRLAISGGKYLRHKPAAVVTSARRAGTTTALEAMEKVPQFFEMPLISSTYWPMVHGGKAEEVLSDEEGLQIMRNLGRNMAWMLRCIEAGKAAGIAAPVAENDKRTNFIR